ncbi:phosphatase PAP2 family protein [Aeromicrobium stalagmiti]|uniref:phosphatase PAP2 family protein n=1 Tax=Aeromicrobium stalagmiti TaxID=2738988 RepID=UPI0015688E9B|nr:phosphatase PAP2 family protein [Aeromicrobium stalagmiti]NRQ48618.1 phosphatase PAP2 family protein [Aeromicrobium stalagmiti]
MDAVDLEIARWVADHRTVPLTRVCRFLEDLGTSWIFFAVAALVGLVVVARLRVWASLPSVIGSMLVTVVVTGPLKEVFDRPRPPADLAITSLAQSSMPSSHAVITSAATIAVVLAPWWTSIAWRRVVAALGVVGCVVSAAAMIYLGGHWLTDVLVGWLLGGAITGGVMIAWRRLSLPGARRPSVASER